jgi:hypothetical protein
MLEHGSDNWSFMLLEAAATHPCWRDIARKSGCTQLFEICFTLFQCLWQDASMHCIARYMLLCKGKGSAERRVLKLLDDR